ncbi:MAG: hypothetical protein AAFY74_20605, partial [Pseudomonadota bacterium]
GFLRVRKHVIIDIQDMPADTPGDTPAPAPQEDAEDEQEDPEDEPIEDDMFPDAQEPEDAEGKDAGETAGGVDMAVGETPEPGTPTSREPRTHTFDEQDLRENPSPKSAESTPRKALRSKRAQDIDIPTTAETEARKRPAPLSSPTPKRKKITPSASKHAPPPSPKAKETMEVVEDDEDEDEDEDSEEDSPRQPPEREKSQGNPKPPAGRKTLTSQRANQPASSLADYDQQGLETLLNNIFMHTSQIEDMCKTVGNIGKFVDDWKRRHRNRESYRAQVLNWVNSMSTPEQHRRMRQSVPSVTPEDVINDCITQIDKAAPGRLNDEQKTALRKAISMPLTGFSEAVARLYSADDDLALNQYNIDEIASRILKLELFMARTTSAISDIQQGMVALLGRDSDKPPLQ